MDGADEGYTWNEVTWRGTSGYHGVCTGWWGSTSSTAPPFHEIEWYASQQVENDYTDMQPTAPFMTSNPFFPENLYGYAAQQNALASSMEISSYHHPHPHPKTVHSSASSTFAGMSEPYPLDLSTDARDASYGGYQTEYASNGTPFQQSPYAPIIMTPSFVMSLPPQSSSFASDSYPGMANGYPSDWDNAPSQSFPAHSSAALTQWCDRYTHAGQAPGYRRRNIAVPCAQARQLPSGQRECPFCDYTQKGRRAQDLRRHIATHTRPTETVLWSCCGVPRADAAKYGLPDAVLGGADVFMVGGCGQPFSRRDALQRHLRERRGRCFGDASADWHPGNTI